MTAMPRTHRLPAVAPPLHPYAASVLAELSQRLPWEVEFLQAVHEVFSTISVVLERDPRLKSLRILERMVEPERVVAFRVVWTDDRNQVQVNRGYRVQFSSVLGPYKGGLRFHSSVSLDGLKFLGFEQVFKNALTGLPMGGGKGGSDLATRGLSDGELMRFCQAFMSELYRHIGPETDVPAGDIGVGTREIGYLFGQYRRLTDRFHGVLTGKGLGWGGSLLRPEATGFGLAYFAEEMLRTRGESLEGKRVAISGFGNVAWGAATKVSELGARVVTLSGPDGFVYDPDGLDQDKLDFMLQLRLGGQDRIQPYAERYGVAFTPDKRPWIVPVDVAMPCAIQNELDLADAEALVDGGCQVVAEGANMPCSPEAVARIQAGGLLFSPGKASNAGGVAMSGLEMSQNRTMLQRDSVDLDAALRATMRRIHDTCVEAAQTYDRPGDYVAGANIAGFTKVAEAMLDQGAV